MRTDTMCHYWEEALDWSSDESEEDGESTPRTRVDGQSPVAD
ncbi:hypothetical protein [Halospeciosus flavus]|uniref:Uncharacterized protein n=1 Tax=Halospeciosus flavus TaxID=3032283 RepID=A0ABD5Z739_9EURY|nr:hypothetical protein [Halospeciosus flavus]